jgi:hypothetical protein
MVRRALFPELALGITEPSGPNAADPSASARWPHILATTLVHAGDTALVLRRGSRDPRTLALGTRAAIAVAAEVAAATSPGPLDGISLEHAHGMLTAAVDTLERLSERGWSALSGDLNGGVGSRPLGGNAIAERTEAFDPFGVVLGQRT